MTSYLESLPFGEWLLPVAFLAGGLLLGLLVETYLLRKVRQVVDRTRWKWDELVLGALRGMAFVWFAAAGVYAARQAASLPSTLATMVDKVVIVAVDDRRGVVEPVGGLDRPVVDLLQHGVVVAGQEDQVRAVVPDAGRERPQSVGNAVWDPLEGVEDVPGQHDRPRVELDEQA